jgi:Uma2 family endonuclease
MEKNVTPFDSPGGRLSCEEFLLLPDDGRRHELIDGKHLVSPSPNLRHQELVGRLHFEIERFLRQNRGAGRVFLARLDVVLSKWDVVEPDLLFVAGDQLEILTAANVQGAPALVIEVLSPGTRRMDEQDKRRLFDRSGVREYWLVDPTREAVTVFPRRTNPSRVPCS